MAIRETHPVRRTDSANVPFGSASIGGTSAWVVSPNPQRVEVTICNDHATQVAYLALGTVAALNGGIRLAPGQSYTTGAYTGAIAAIATGAATVLTYAEA